MTWINTYINKCIKKNKNKKTKPPHTPVTSLTFPPPLVSVSVVHPGVLPHQQQPLPPGTGAGGFASSHPVADQLAPPAGPPIGHPQPVGSGSQLPQSAQWKGCQVSIQEFSQKIQVRSQECVYSGNYREDCRSFSLPCHLSWVGSLFCCFIAVHTNTSWICTSLKQII